MVDIFSLEMMLWLAGRVGKEMMPEKRISVHHTRRKYPKHRRDYLVRHAPHARNEFIKTFP